MNFPLNFGDISLLLAVLAVILVVTSEIISPYYGRLTMLISREKLRKVSLVFFVLFLATLIIRVFEVVLSR